MAQQRPDPRIEARLAVQRAPDDAMAWILLSDVELGAGDARNGAGAAQRALQLAPGHPEALARLGRGLWMLGRHREAAQALRAAAQNAPGHAGIAVWLGHALEDAGEAEAANEAYARAHALAPEHPQIAAYLLAWRRRLCDWRGIDALSRQVRTAVAAGDAAIEPFAFLSEDADAAEQLACARLRAEAVAAHIPRLPPAPVRSDARLRVGFMSNGFGAHPTGLLTAAFFEALRAHDRVDIHLFALNADDGSIIRRRLQASAHALHDVADRPHAEIAGRIRDADLDVLFDLRGWGGGGRPEVLAMRPAPLQVNWLAYPGTSGAPWIDYVLADRVVLPAELAIHSEQPAWLPRCFQPSDTRREVPPAPSRAGCGLPETGIVFCCFNNSYKLNPASFARLMAVLRQVPGSVLWLLSGPGEADRRLREAAEADGIDPDRLVFMPKQPQATYLARLQLADLFLDCNPYNAHTTASDALWAGCPVLTRPGATFAARVAASLNHHLGMDELNVDDDAAFVALATALGNDPPRLAALRHRVATLRERSGLFDMGGFATDFAGIVTAMVERQRRGDPPAPLSLAAG
ncbi:UDP-N-acetylglucosamine-peptide N-acetylglucosaminyltransferase [Luteimonas yindakuii]|uniref:O-linked N-acetylglucosamine transferase, SPINDLY family protein n=1 Tax=Luteimonas yindakuii TaxID=2565782 RepID=UPI0010A47B7A|nr:UDP-N-acetylglucosamine-peptide N-acetylglucosaminyltransferase [Luteimonas yindakuii]QCO68238.1 UDP-N-acetylglucosamine-peptide N-acetylglucosaminyltransferase [Luteimonas yindakuii]